jgi:hypothetical protein
LFTVMVVAVGFSKSNLAMGRVLKFFGELRY